FTREAAIGSDVRERYVGPGDQERFLRELYEKGFVRDFEVKLRKRDGTEMDCVMTATRCRAEDGRNLGVQGIIRDITERKQAEDALLRQTREVAVLEERNRMAREIHDTLAQGFTGIVLQLEAAEQASDDSPTEVPEHLSRAKNLARESLQEARRSVWNPVPQALERRPLDTALQEEVRRFGAAGTEKASFTLSGEPRSLPSELQAALLRICQESLTNVRRHARATEVKVTLSFEPESVCLGVEDDGVGFDVQSVKDGEMRTGFGLTGIEQRARLLRGTFALHSQQGKGTLVEVTIPTG
ncbi:MAG: histidine kinase, partial [Dehalococcoidia bacterium]